MTNPELEETKECSCTDMEYGGGFSDDDDIKINSNTLTAFKNKVKDGKRAIVRMKRRRQEDLHLDAFMSDLLRLEAQLRTEQTQILSLLATRDATISVQRQEIDRLRRENRRLLSRLKKMAEARDERCPDGSSSGGAGGGGKKKEAAATTGMGSRPLGAKQSVMTTLASQFYEKTALQFTDANGRIIDRVMHKPPIAEKPKISASTSASAFAAVSARVSQHHQPHQRMPVTAAVVRALSGGVGGSRGAQCNIVSTISRLLEEESDPGLGGHGSCSSGSSDEPSSPEATLKPSSSSSSSSSTPRVLKLARQYERGDLCGGSSSSSESSSSCGGRSGDEQSVKALVMDEYEVTSGYNSDAVSDLDHDYENVLLLRGEKGGPPRFSSDGGGKEEGRGEEEDDDDDNYVILRAVRDSGSSNAYLIEEEEKHIYSNIEYGVKEENNHQHHSHHHRLPSAEHDEVKSLVLVTDLDNSRSHETYEERKPRARENQDTAKNVPRSRHNIDLVMNASEDSRLMENFEEFTLDSLDLEEFNGDCSKGKENLPITQLRHSGDGAEAKTPPTKEQKEAKNSLMPGQGGYEKFLEVTGLSQKSILTPSRMFSNHRSVLKPRDIKHRDKLRSAFTSLSTLEEDSPSGTPVNIPTSDHSSSSSQRYWREPYL